jgi:hypothetical protein
MTGTDAFLLIVQAVMGVLCLVLLAAAFRAGYRDGYSDGAWDTEFPEWADGPRYEKDVDA